MNTRVVIGFPRESTPGDRRTLLTPTVARTLTEAGFTVIAESGIATGVDCPDVVLHTDGVRFADASEVWSEVRLDSHCPRHGPYRETIEVTGSDGWYDANTPIRSIQKGFLLAAERDLYQACSISIDGADWGGAWHAHVLAPALAALDIPVRQWPVSVFTPMILDRSGGKLSKTLYVRYGPTYADLPEAFLNLDILLDHHGDDALNALWAEVQRWATEPRRLQRAYTVDHLTSLLPKITHPPQRLNPEPLL